MEGRRQGKEGDSDSEEELPAGWEERTTTDDRVYYANHNERTTQWTHPRSGRMKRLVGDLPEGWYKSVINEGSSTRVCFVNDKTQTRTLTDPRLAFAVYVQGGQCPQTATSQHRQRFDSCTKARQVLSGEDFTDKVFLITGADSGIGFQTALSLAKHNAHIVMACRNLPKAEKAKRTIENEKYGAKVDVIECDLTSMNSVRRCALTFLNRNLQLNVLILNAAYLGPWQLTQDGFEQTFAVNHLSQAYLTRLLIPKLKQSAPARIVFVSAESHRFLLHPILDSSHFSIDRLSPNSSKNYWYLDAYATSKLCNILYAFALNRRTRDFGVVVNAAHPGNMVYTGLIRHSCLLRCLYTLASPYTKTLEQAAATVLFAAAAPELHLSGANYLNNCWFCTPSHICLDLTAQDALYRLTDHLLDNFDSQLEPL